MVRPEVSQAELDQTLIFAGMAVLGLLGIIDEMFGHVAPSGSLVRLRDGMDVFERRTSLQDRPESLDTPRKFVDCLGQGDYTRDLRKIGVGRASGEQSKPVR